MTPDDHVPPAAKSGFIGKEASITVFLVDDDADFRDTICQILVDDGYEVTAASDGAEALEHLAAMADAHVPLPDLLLLDFVMPKLSGLGVLQALWRLTSLPPTILMTGFPDKSVEAFAENLGAFCVLRKPVKSATLCAAVSEAVSAGPRLRARARGG